MKNLVTLRNEIDAIDDKIIELLAERMKLVKKISKQKEKTGFPVFDKKREEQVKKIWALKAKSLKMESRHIKQILEKILNISKEVQRRTMK